MPSAAACNQLGMPHTLASLPCLPQVEMPGVDADTTFISKPIKPLILATGRAVCLYKVGPWGWSSVCRQPYVQSSSSSPKWRGRLLRCRHGSTKPLATGVSTKLTGHGGGANPALWAPPLRTLPTAKCYFLTHLAATWRRPPQVNDRIYATDANSTAYKYPLADASILSVKGAPAGGAGQRAGHALRALQGSQLASECCCARCQSCGDSWLPAAHRPAACPTAVEVPLDGTVYDLATGKARHRAPLVVLHWKQPASLPSRLWPCPPTPCLLLCLEHNAVLQ